MTNIHFWQGITGDLTIWEDMRYQPLIQQLLRGDFSHGLRLKQLHNTNIYSARIDKKTRLLFTTFKNNLCLLELMFDHNYKDAHFLNDGVVNHYLSESLPVIPNKIIFIAESPRLVRSMEELWLEQFSHNQNDLNAAVFKTNQQLIQDVNHSNQEIVEHNPDRFALWWNNYLKVNMQIASRNFSNNEKKNLK